MVLLAAVSLWILGLHQLQRSREVYPAVSLDSLDADAIVVLGGGRAFDGFAYHHGRYFVIIVFISTKP